MQSIKYIVYLTVCKITKKFYVGVHKTYSDKFDGYLGNGVVTTKPSSYKFSETPFRRAVNKYGPDQFIRITLFEYDNENDAYKKESEIVTEEFLKRKDIYNACIGGCKPPEWSSHPVYQYDLNGNYIKSFNRVIDAAQEIGVKACSIADAYREHNNCKGYLWSYEKKDKIKPYINKRAKRKVAVYDKSGNLIKIYESVMSCKKDYCGCVHVLAGVRKHAKGCTFRYLDEV